jgi:polysaccharide export outer membrane protein
MSRRSLILISALALICAGPDRARAQSTEVEGPSSATGDALAQQLLRPGDIVRLKIWREPDLSGDFQVDETGVVVFPLIGPRTVTDVPPDSLRSQLVDAYATYLRHPSIDVVLLRRVNVLGAVAKAGLYPVDPTMTVADVLALAGGPTSIGDPNKVRLIRDGETITASLGQRTIVGELPVRSGDQFFVPERSWISRNSNIVAAAITGTISLIIAVWVK